MKTQAKGNRQRAKALSRRLHMPPGELLHVITSAGLTALEHEFTHRGDITFPLELHAGGKDHPPQPDTLPVYLPAAEVLLLRDLCKASGIQAGADWIIEDMVRSSARDSLLSKNPAMNGGPDMLASLWNLREQDIAAMQAVIDRWNAGEEKSS